jgi:chloramphenicol 3-O-phosphotransferase
MLQCWLSLKKAGQLPLIIMLNGSFGVGKSSTAQLLCERLPNAIIFDPEMVGHLVRMLTAGILPESELTDDFQDIAMWRTLSIAAARDLVQQYRRDLIIPMTLANPAYYAEFRTELKQIDPRLYHFCLIAPLDTIKQRLLGRGDSASGWTFQKAERCVPALADERFQTHIDTEHLTIEATVTQILEYLRA